MLTASEGPGDLSLLTWTPEEPGPPAAQAADAYAQLLDWLEGHDSVLLLERVFGDLAAAPCVRRARGGRLAERAAAAPTYVEGAPAGRGSLAGLHAVAVRPGAEGRTQTLVFEGEVYGRLVEAEGATFLALSDVGRIARGRGPLEAPEEARATLLAAEQLLASFGWSFHDVVRTWFYLRDILDWYGEFNRVRSSTYCRLGLLGPPGTGCIPASTGIDGRNAAGGWCALDLLAARPRPGTGFAVRRLHNPRQSEATEYGSAFARGLELVAGEGRYVFVSGTAAIDEEGRSIREGDFEGQVVATLERVAALLGSAGASLDDVRQATAFLKSPGDARAFSRWSAALAVGRLVRPAR